MAPTWTTRPRVQSTSPGVNPGFFLGGGAPLMNDITDRWCKQMLQNPSYIRTSQTILGEGAHPLHLPPRSAHVAILPLCSYNSYIDLPSINAIFTEAMNTSQDDLCFPIHAYTALFLRRLFCSYFINPVDKGAPYLWLIIPLLHHFITFGKENV